MPICPKCQEEYDEGIGECADCLVPLVEPAEPEEDAAENAGMEVAVFRAKDEETLDLMQRAMALSSSTTKKDVIHEALRLYVRLKSRKNLMELAGQIRLCPDYDHKALREVRK